jgi:hypothetical protein
VHSSVSTINVVAVVASLELTVGLKGGVMGMRGDAGSKLPKDKVGQLRTRTLNLTRALKAGTIALSYTSSRKLSPESRDSKAVN